MAIHNLAFDPELTADLAELHDDSEEDLVGADWHQTAIRVVNEGLLLVGPERGLPWHVGNQLTTLMGQIGDKNWRPCPDISVHPAAGMDAVLSFDTRVHGAPTVVIEVASESTYRYDLEAKRRSYARVGVQEYLVFDPTHDWLGTAVRAWHATAHGFEAWLPTRDGAWHSRELGISFQVDGMLLRVVDADGVMMPHITEFGRLLREQQQEAEAYTRRLRVQTEEADRRAEEQARRIAELEAELRRNRQGDQE
ncbi:MAG TPA: Uma2 family endonuclease [Chloroflexota bacterium]|nr:Uma2 family endonuclease [Chloroflexota bacterium]